MSVTLDPRVVALGAARLVGREGIYEARGIDGTHEQKHAAVEQLFRQALNVGGHRPDDYAILDGYDENGDIVADYGIHTASAFRFLYRKLGWRLAQA